MLKDLIGQFNVLFRKKKTTSNNIAAAYNPFSQVRSREKMTQKLGFALQKIKHGLRKVSSSLLRHAAYSYIPNHTISHPREQMSS
jgi:deoxyhypusine synthase